MTSGDRKNPLLVAVYVEAPRKKRFMTNNGQHNHQRRHLHHHHHHHHQLHHHHHLFVHQKPRQNGYNRRAELLDYSRRLRESAKPQKPPLLQLQARPANSLQRSRSQIIPNKNKSRPARIPTCFGTLTIRLPGISWTKKNQNSRTVKARMKSIVKIFPVQRRGGFFSRMFGSLRRKR